MFSKHCFVNALLAFLLLVGVAFVCTNCYFPKGNGNTATEQKKLHEQDFSTLTPEEIQRQKFLPEVQAMYERLCEEANEYTRKVGERQKIALSEMTQNSLGNIQEKLQYQQEPASGQLDRLPEELEEKETETKNKTEEKTCTASSCKIS